MVPFQRDGHGPRADPRLPDRRVRVGPIRRTHGGRRRLGRDAAAARRRDRAAALDRREVRRWQDRGARGAGGSDRGPPAHGREGRAAAGGALRGRPSRWTFRLRVRVGPARAGTGVRRRRHALGDGRVCHGALGTPPRGAVVGCRRKPAHRGPERGRHGVAGGRRRGGGGTHPRRRGVADDPLRRGRSGGGARAGRRIGSGVAAAARLHGRIPHPRLLDDRVARRSQGGGSLLRRGRTRGRGDHDRSRVPSRSASSGPGTTRAGFS